MALPLAYFIETFSPFIVRWGHTNFGIRWYGTAYLTGFIVGYLLLRKLVREGRLQLPLEKLMDFVLFVAIFGVVIGGRLGEAVLYRPHMFTEFTSSFPYWQLLALQDGGMSAHGGIIGVLVATWIFARRNKINFLNLIDGGAMVAPIGIGFGRIANFINGELYGHVWHSPWAWQFPSELIYPPQLKIEPTIKPGAVSHLAEQVLARHPNLAPQMATPESMRMTLLNMARDGHPFVVAQLRHILPPRIPSQLIEASLEGLLLFIICWCIGRYWRKAGMASGAFAVFYPIMRIIGEQFRVGDQPKRIFGHWISLGIIYSVPMLILGLVYWIWMMRRPAPQPAPATVPAATASRNPPMQAVERGAGTGTGPEEK
ncbi:MAG: prolipoprotein diacylglyceryl transferase [Phycisphaerae bacterium]